MTRNKNAWHISTGGLEYDMEVACDAYGHPLVDVSSANPHAPRIEYSPSSTQAQPTVSLQDHPRLTADEADELAISLSQAADAMRQARDAVLDTYRLRSTEPGGDGERRARAIAELVARHEAEGTGAPSHEEMAQAIASCYEDDERCDLQRELDALHNACVGDAECESRLIDLDAILEAKARAYWKARETHERLSHARPDEYDATAALAANARRTAAHNELVGVVCSLSRLAKRLGLETWLANVADQRPKEYPTRETIAQMARELVDAR